MKTETTTGLRPWPPSSPEEWADYLLTMASFRTPENTKLIVVDIVKQIQEQACQTKP